MSAVYEIQTVCECQAILGADLDAEHNVLSGWARRGGSPRETAPANTVAPSSERFDVVWHCPICGRNSLRTFYAGALARKPDSAETPSSETPSSKAVPQGDEPAAQKSA